MMKFFSILIFIGCSASMDAMYFAKTIGLSDKEASQYDRINEKITLGTLVPVDLAFISRDAIELLFTTYGRVKLYEAINKVIAEAGAKESDFFSPKNVQESSRKLLQAQSFLLILEQGNSTEASTEEFAMAKEALKQIDGAFARDQIQAFGEINPKENLLIEPSINQEMHIFRELLEDYRPVPAQQSATSQAHYPIDEVEDSAE